MNGIEAKRDSTELTEVVTAEGIGMAWPPATGFKAVHPRSVGRRGVCGPALEDRRSALGNFKNDAGNFGIMLQLFSETRHLRRDGIEVWGYDTIKAKDALGNPYRNREERSPRSGAPLCARTWRKDWRASEKITWRSNACRDDTIRGVFG